MKKFTAQLAGKVVLSEVDDKYNANVYSMVMPDPDAGAEQKRLQALKAEIARRYPHKRALPAGK